MMVFPSFAGAAGFRSSGTCVGKNGPHHHRQFIMAHKDVPVSSWPRIPGPQLAPAARNGASIDFLPQEARRKHALRWSFQTGHPQRPVTIPKRPEPRINMCDKSQIYLPSFIPPQGAQKRMNRSHFPLLKNMGLKL